MPLLLAGYARGPFRRLSLGRRFWLAMATASSCWAMLMIMVATQASISTEFVFDLTAGAAILLTAGLVVYSIWSLASFGFTVLMLLCLAERNEALSLESWAAAYGQGDGMHAFTHDRVAVLVGAGLAEVSDERINLKGISASRFTALVISVAHLFAIPIEK